MLESMVDLIPLTWLRKWYQVLKRYGDLIHNGKEKKKKTQGSVQKKREAKETLKSVGKSKQTLEQ